MKPQSNRAIEIARILKPHLLEGEYVVVLGRDMNAMVLVPGELQSRLESGGALTVQDTAPAVISLLMLLVKTTRDHIATIYGKEAVERVIQVPSMLGPDGQPIKA